MNNWSDRFMSNLFVSHLGSDETLLRQAQEHFFGVHLEPDDGIQPAPEVVPRQHRQKLSEAEEFALAWSLIASSHENEHFFQFGSTAFGIFNTVISGLEFATLRGLPRFIVAAAGRNRPALPLLAAAEEVNDASSFVESGLSDLEKYRFLRNVFDNPTLGEFEAVVNWNQDMEYLDGLDRTPGDEVCFRRFSRPVGHRKANPEGVTVRGILEACARLKDFNWIVALQLSPSNTKQFFSEFSGSVYTQLITSLEGLCEFRHIGPILLKAGGIAMQTPLTSLHSNTNDGFYDGEWKNFAPTWRYARIVEALRSGEFETAKFVDDPGAAEEMCAMFEWPSVTGQMERFAETRQMPLTPLWAYLTNYHSRFCSMAAAHEKRPTWLPEIFFDYRMIQGADWRAWASFHPPLHIANGVLVAHATANPKLIMALVNNLLVSECAHDLAYEDTLAKTNRLLQSIVPFLGGAEVWDELWPKIFYGTFGIAPDAFTQTTKDNGKE